MAHHAHDPHHEKREQALSRFIDGVARDGFLKTYVEGICREVGISNREFYRWFGRKDRCYLSTFDALGSELLDAARRAFEETTGPWEEKLRAGLEVAADDLAASPRTVRFLMEYQAVEHGSSALWRLIGSAERVYLTDEVRDCAPPTPGTALDGMATSAIIEPMLRYVEQGKLDELPDLVPWIVYYATLHVFGPERAARLHPASA